MLFILLIQTIQITKFCMKTESRIGMEIVGHLEYLKLIYRILYLNRNFEREPFNLLTKLIN